MLSRSSVQAVAASRASAAASTTIPALRATTAVATPRNLALRIVPSPPPIRPSAAVDKYLPFYALFNISDLCLTLFIFIAPGRKRGREAAGTWATVGEVVQAETVAAEEEVPEPSRKRLLLVLSEGKDEEEVPPATDEVVVVESATAEVPDVEVVAAEVPDAEAAVAEPSSVALAGPLPAVTTVPSLATTAPVEPSLVIPRRPR
ncbi:hypothetical protein Pyn_32243 [Prunus yedoensis var. nudiflora]|uniref:Uncharacterized protein n=1 Tax=Prunus yedoensis var. nudiflora TaxID=2094558 RepID=A0A314Y0D2_PRUYE|nr:hypothetical protein Pyn_32243 [Prunus yedoensis var. nudiflora]